ncbi:hypothetical protein MNEG_15588 [Monoraphidium neglectum]|uniref:Uncharacterized protein n=1 Tax=Monoraphidium neglectum TaxID=145388 RepID=A0A0D2MAJ5_9CHLO|nr:hypothetical protein MNEG_15588 [Monoraphidium neglectum]KIY92375.1 hypothetical protein MNEG_15588 [Monoraphidium neglectum]|eukprot:XP_013891395.1 hypothetical protein MNEG_15588 [Monoraphidium neglectum]
MLALSAAPRAARAQPAAAAPKESPAATAAGRPGASVRQVPAFTGVVSCAPFTVLVAPSSGPGNASSVLLEADPEVSSAVALQVADATLYVSLTSDFASRAPIKLTARVPADKLTRVASRGGATGGGPHL